MNRGEYHDLYTNRMDDIVKAVQNEDTIPTNELPYHIEIIAQRLTIPWALDISRDGKLYVTERTGRIWIMKEGAFLPEPLIEFPPPFISYGECGLMGIVLDPDFSQNHYIYVMHSYIEGKRTYNRVIRLIEQNDKAFVDIILLDKIPGGSVHNGGRIKVGPDGKLYITTGDSGNSYLAQDISSKAGKILRINLDGSIPSDNPFNNSPVYSYGHRDPQGLSWSLNQITYEAEHGPIAHDEINIIKPGGNYGWPLVQGNEDSGYISPLIQSNETTWAPSGIAFVTKGSWEGRLLVAALRGERLISISFNREGNQVERVEYWLVNQFGRLREVIQAEDGSIYLTTSNRDGRGNPKMGDDKIIRLV